jgi:hypothetical protein
MSATIDDEGFAAEVRAMLARRAADIPSPADGEVPPLPSGLRFSIDPPHRDRRRGLLLAAAVIVLLLGAVGVVAVNRGDGTRERTGPADAPTRPTGPMPAIGGLPQGITTEDLLPLWTDPPGPDRLPKEEDGDVTNAPLVLHRYLLARLGEIGAGTRSQDVEGYPDWSRAIFRLNGGEGSAESDEMTAYLWWSGEAWSVMAVLSRVVDMTELVVDSERVFGTIYGDGQARIAAVGPQDDRLTIARWQDSLDVVGENDGGDTGLVVDAALPPEPITFLVAPVVVTPDASPDVSEIAFDPRRLAVPGPTTVPTIPDSGSPSEGVEVVGVPVDAPVGVAVQSVLPEGEDLVAAQHRFDGGRLDIVELSTVVDGAGYTISLYRAFTDEEHEGDGTPTGWGRAWSDGVAGYASVTVESDTGVALDIHHEDPERAASHDALLAMAEMLVNDPVVAAVARGADPAG